MRPIRSGVVASPAAMIGFAKPCLAMALTLALSSMAILSGCTAKEAIKTPVNIIGMLFGAVPPPEQTTVLQELTREYDRCVADGGGPECAQSAYSTVRRAKGLDDKPLPAGVVIVRRDDGTVVEQMPVPPPQP